MIKRSERFLKQLVGLIDAAAIVLAFLSTYALRQHLHLFYRLDLFPGEEVLEALHPLSDYVWLLAITLPLWIGMLQLMGAYHELRNKSVRQIAWALLKGCTLSVVFFGAIVFLLKLSFVSRTFVTMFFLLSFIFLALVRAAMVVVFKLALRRGYFHRNLLIVGTGRRAHHFIRSVRAHAGWGLRLAGLLDRDPQMVGRHVAGASIIGTVDDLPRVLREQVIDEVIFVVPRSWMDHIEPALQQCEELGVRATVAVDLFNLHIAQSNQSDYEGIPLISYDTAPVDAWQLAFKRTVDVLVSGLGLLALLPAFAIIAVLIRATSRGPIFFRQTRSGLNGRQFTLYKFRSMVTDAEAKLDKLRHLNELSGPVFKLTNDPRLTSVGKWLRKTSLDELPQLYNVFKGEMSLVGPRPPIPKEVAQYKPWQRRRLSMRPGITGMWQVSGRNQIKDFDEWMRLDLEYIDQWSVLLDVEILLKTLPAVLLGVGAK
jgi:exopolysaccharide biosynthesis polyprenyl glycosylphosphotransferase